MKKFFLTAVAILAIGSSLSAQDFGFRKESKIVEGSVSYGSGKEDGIKYSRLILHTNLGYILSEKVAIGPRALIVDYHQLLEEVPKVHAVTTGLFGRYYFLNLGKRFKTYTEVQSSYELIQVTSL